jgi:sugar/nucleoside kinase (ribokinase family)
MKYDVITIGGSTEDINFYVEDYQLLDNQQNPGGNQLLAFDYGTKIDIKKASLTFGGGAANTAVCFASLGLKTAGMITYGNDERGRKIVANLKRRKVDTRLMKRVANDISGFSFIVIGANKDHVAFSHRAANSAMTITKADQKNLKKSPWLFITSLSGNWRPVLDNIFKIVDGTKVSWNPGELQLKVGHRVLAKYFRKTTVLTMNKDEATQLVMSHTQHTSKSYDFFAITENLLKIIHSWGPEIVVITNGEHGAYAYDGKEVYFQDVIYSKRKEDTTGLGDAFGSSFVTGLILYKDINKALFLAAHNSAACLSKQGAQNGLLTKHDLPRLERLYQTQKK